jgi:hypothetical protein
LYDWLIAQPYKTYIDEVDDAGHKETDVVLFSLGLQYFIVEEAGRNNHSYSPAEAEGESSKQRHEQNDDGQQTENCPFPEADRDGAFAHLTVVLHIANILLYQYPGHYNVAGYIEPHSSEGAAVLYPRLLNGDASASGLKPETQINRQD